MPTGWARWHDEYDDPGSALAARLRLVTEETRRAISRVSPGPVRLVSICAGQGRDVVAALDGHPRRPDVTAVLLEGDAANVASARTRAEAAGLTNVTVIQADASLTDAYADHVPADVLLMCGIFGHLSTSELRRSISRLPSLLAADATVIWTRHLGSPRGNPDLTPTIRDWFCEAGFTEIAFHTARRVFGVGAHQLVVPPDPLTPGERLFNFVPWSGR
jgi:hypothetical protein